MIFDVLILVSIIVWVLGLVLRGALDAATAAYALVGLVVLLGFARRIGTSVAGLTLRVALPVVSLLTFSTVFGTQLMGQLLIYAIVVLVILFGFYVMVRGGIH